MFMKKVFRTVHAVHNCGRAYRPHIYQILKIVNTVFQFNMFTADDVHILQASKKLLNYRTDTPMNVLTPKFEKKINLLLV